MIDGKELWALLDCIRRCLKKKREKELITEIMNMVDEWATIKKGEQ